LQCIAVRKESKNIRIAATFLEREVRRRSILVERREADLLFFHLPPP
jgi:hypothetical protein